MDKEDTEIMTIVNETGSTKLSGNFNLINNYHNIYNCYVKRSVKIGICERHCLLDGDKLDNCRSVLGVGDHI